jgi:hypothetical protein
MERLSWLTDYRPADHWLIVVVALLATLRPIPVPATLIPGSVKTAFSPPLIER